VEARARLWLTLILGSVRLKSSVLADVAQLVEQPPCKRQVVGSSPSVSSWSVAGRGRQVRACEVGYRSGQTGQTVNLLAHAFVGSNPTPTMA